MAIVKNGACSECGKLVLGEEGKEPLTNLGRHFCAPQWEVYEVLNQEPEDAGLFRAYSIESAVRAFASDYYSCEPFDIDTPTHVKAREVGDEGWRDYYFTGEWDINWSAYEGEPA